MPFANSLEEIDRVVTAPGYAVFDNAQQWESKTDLKLTKFTPYPIFIGKLWRVLSKYSGKIDGITEGLCCINILDFEQHIALTLCDHQPNWLISLGISLTVHVQKDPDSKVHGANMGPRQDPGVPHVGRMNLAIWGSKPGAPFINMD